MSEEFETPTPEAPQGTETAPEAVVQGSESAPAESQTPVESGPSAAVAAVDAAQVAADKADKSLREEVVEWTHHIGASILHEHSQYVDIPESSTSGPRQEQFIGR